MVATEDGYELTWQVNVLAPYVLTSLLLDSVKERIVNVSSISAGSQMDFDNLNQVTAHQTVYACNLWCAWAPETSACTLNDW